MSKSIEETKVHLPAMPLDNLKRWVNPFWAIARQLKPEFLSIFRQILPPAVPFVSHGSEYPERGESQSLIDMQVKFPLDAISRRHK